jgi:cell wall-associated NlpC family hydrolase
MRLWAKLTVASLLCTCGLRPATAQDEDYRHTRTSTSVAADAPNNQDQYEGRTLSDDDRLSVLAAALDARALHSERDCSHLVHAIYEQAGFPYDYAASSQLYAGIKAFRRVKQPQPGDLVVWRGHAGIVIKPSQHLFFSFLRSGPGIDDYEAPYWKSRGRPHFYRYICTGCHSADTQSHRLVKVNR